MKVAFIAHRANYLKHYGPIIDAALERGWQVEAWLQEVGMGGGKDYLRITPKTIANIWGERLTVRVFVQKEQAADLQKSAKADALVSLHPRNYYSGEMDHEAKFITLQHSVDTFVWNKPSDLASSDYVCLFTPYWWQYAEQYYEQADGIKPGEWENDLRAKVAYTGFAQMDAFDEIDSAEVRLRWGIGAEQPVVLLLPVDLAGWRGAWPPFFAAETGLKQWRALLRGGPGFMVRYWQWALRGWNDVALTGAIRQFCDESGAFLLVKGREKDPLRPVLVGKADKSFYDESHYPPTIFEAISIASLCIVFYSTAAQEAAYAGVPSLCVDRPNNALVKHRLWRRKDEGGPYNYPGVVEWTTIPRVISEFPDRSLSDFQMDSRARKDYLQKYNGPADHKASQRILDLVS